MPNHLSHNQQRVDASQFSMVPRADIPRSTFTTDHTLKTTFDGGYLVPVLLEEVLPGDHHKGEMTIFARMNTLIFPLMDHITLESFFFFVPNRLVWDNWPKMMGERNNPTDAISFTPPLTTLPVGGIASVNSIFDYMGLPIGVLRNQPLTVTSMPLRAYNLIHNEWFRDENLQNQLTAPTGDGPDNPAFFTLMRRNKRHDYFTSALPWPMKDPTSGLTQVPGVRYMGDKFPITGLGILPATGYVANSGGIRETGDFPSLTNYTGAAATAVAGRNIFIETADFAGQAWPAVYADLTQAAANTVNALRLAVQTQRFLERDARSGTRYTELLRAHFGVRPEDSRLQRPEYIGGGKTPLITQAIPQTAPAAGPSTPLGSLGAQATLTGQHTFRYAATEHGYILGMIHVDADLSYQQGLHRLWKRNTRYDYYWPVFAHLGEQPIYNYEIYCVGNPTPGLTTQDEQTFGYQERWAEYRHRPSKITGYFRSDLVGSLDDWHSAQFFTSLPTLNTTFIQSTPPFERNLSAGVTANGVQFLADMLFRISSTRPMPMYSVPGMMDHF